MNQNNNVFNQTNSNSQGNNGVPNNQPLNNQNYNQDIGFNQQRVNPQPTTSFEQPIIQETTPQSMNIFESGNTSNQNFNSKPPKKLNIGLIVAIIASVAVVAIIIITIIVLSNDKNMNDSNNSSNINNTDSKDDENQNVNDNRLTSSKLDLYNTINDSNYLTAVLYDPLKERQGNGDKDSFDKAILVTYNLEEKFKDSFLNNNFSVVAERKNGPSLKYYFGLMSNKYVTYSCISTNVLKEGSFGIAVKEKEENGIHFYTNKTISSLSTIDKNYRNDYHIYSTNFEATDNSKLSNKKSTDTINLKIGKTSEENIYVSMKLKEKVSYGNSFITTVENYIKENKFSNTITILDNADNLNSVNKIYGKEVDLSNTIFYQDIIATKISNDYGLNLRNKDFFVHLDTMYIKFKAYGDDNYLTEVLFDYSKEDEDYTVISTLFSENMFLYKDKNDTQYEYFINDGLGQLYVFKNKEYVGKLKVTHKGGISRNLYNDLNYIFGIK